jgi:hypothetical protein
VLGDGVWTRRLGPGSVRRVVDEPHGLALWVRDPALPRLSLRIPDPTLRAAWAARLGALA